MSPVRRLRRLNELPANLVARSRRNRRLTAGQDDVVVASPPAQFEVSVHAPGQAGAYADWMPKLVRRTLAMEGIRGGAVSLQLTDDATIQALNREFRGYDEPTDVLSFGLSELAKPAADGEVRPGFVLPPGSLPQLGEIVLSLPTAERQAAERGIPVVQELELLLVHGILHLLGHDHDQPEETERMRARERAVLAAWWVEPPAQEA